MSTRDELIADLSKAFSSPQSVETVAGWLIAEGWRKKPSDETLWDLANDLLDGLNIEDENPPSLIEYIADTIRDRLALMDRGQ